MAIGLLGKKIGMTQMFDDNGGIVPITLIEAGPCPILQKKTVETDGYNALQLSFGEKKNGRANRPMTGHLAASKAKPARFIRELRFDDLGGYDVGGALDVDLFKPGERVDVAGVSKGKGFAGPIKRHHTTRGPETHGSMYHRRTGSLGQSAWPSRVYKGKPMAGRLGGARSTIQNLEVVRVDKERHQLILRGAVPGADNGYLIISKAVRVKKKAVKK
ncbi:MAG: 50S ribosomal protein L3 [Candidatus Sumerlaeota bacterium]|nr:50S ribosomal protein L3 [Candidatus Sumerlaeota bacterium]